MIAIIEDWYLEHDAFHTSDDWENFKDKCSSCFGALKSNRGTSALKEALGSFEKVDDVKRQLESNPLE